MAKIVLSLPEKVLHRLAVTRGLIRYMLSRSMASPRVALGRYARRVRQI